jgi:hypothetical protein
LRQQDDQQKKKPQKKRKKRKKSENKKKLSGKELCVARYLDGLNGILHLKQSSLSREGVYIAVIFAAKGCVQ